MTRALPPEALGDVRHFLDLSEVPAAALRGIIDHAATMKAGWRKGRPPVERPLAGRTLAMIFEKPSTRTRVSFDQAMRQLGGETIMLTGKEMQLGRGESIGDTARVLSRFVEVICIRILDHSAMQELARHSSVPIINALTKRSHPCQIMADIMTFEEHRGPITGRTVAWSGDGNNVLASWVHAAQRFDFKLRVATPKGLELPGKVLDWARANGADVEASDDPFAAASEADCIVTDCWLSMGDEEKTARAALLKPYQVNAKLMAAAPDAIFMHCLPGPSRRGGHRRGDRRAAIGRLRRGRKPAACPKGHPRLVPGGRRVSGRDVSDNPHDDRILPFAVEPLDVRGRVVRLGPSVDHILTQHKYPAAVARLVGEAAALTVLLGSSLRMEGRFQLQTKSDGSIDMLVVDFDAPDRIRAFARFDAERLAAAPKGEDLLGRGHLAFTIDRGDETSRYQGIVALDGQGLEAAAHQYFRQSEQIPTLVRLAVAENVTGSGAEWRAGGLLVQFLPDSPERQRQADLDPGDAPASYKRAETETDESDVDEAWREALALAETIEDHELVDPTLSSERLLFRLFHERGVRVFSPQTVRDACRCSHDKIEAMLRGFSSRERVDMIGDDGKIGVTCEFCSTHRVFDPEDFDKPGPDKPGPDEPRTRQAGLSRWSGPLRSPRSPRRNSYGLASTSPPRPPLCARWRARSAPAPRTPA